MFLVDMFGCVEVLQHLDLFLLFLKSFVGVLQNRFEPSTSSFEFG